MDAITITPQQAEVLASIFRPILDEQIKLSIEAVKLAEADELRQAREVIKPMKVTKYSTYPKLRKIYSSYREIGNVINKAETTVSKRMNGSIAFTDREKELLLKNNPSNEGQGSNRT